MGGVTLASITKFVGNLETSLKNDVSGFAGFGSTLSEDVGAVVVDAEKIGGAVLAAFTASGNAEAVVVGPLVSIGEALGNAILSALGVNLSGLAPLTVSSGAAKVAATIGSVAASVATAAAAAGAAGVVNASTAAAASTIASGAAGVAGAVAGDDGHGDNDADTGAI